MSTPRSGVVEVGAALPNFTDLVHGSGILVAPDEVLTAAHVVDGPNGVRSLTVMTPGVGSAWSPQASAYSPSTVHIDPGFTPSSDDMEYEETIVHDFALVHLAQPMSGTVYALGTTDGGTLTVGGYPTGTGSTYDEATEKVTSYVPILENSYPGILNGAELGEGGDAHGSSGGPVMDLSRATPTVVGVIAAGSTYGGGGAGEFVQLTAADIAEIQGWIASDHGQTSPGPAPAPAPSPAPPPAPAPVSTPAPVIAPTPTPTPPPAPHPVPVPAPAAPSSLQTLAAAIAGDAAVAPSPLRQTTLTDVSNGLAAAVDAGSTDIESGWSQAAAEIRADSSAPRRALAFLGGLLSALDGTRRSGAAGYASTLFPSLSADGGSKTLGSIATSGWAEMTKLSSGSPTRAASIADLAASIAMPGPVGAVSPASDPTTAQASALVSPAHRHAA